ncbi:MAG: hypothetical protein EXR93_06365 [Gemmatimonadetes bacterium]|nr:hypothetical protein [Gemmatimonadota bacterium]
MPEPHSRFNAARILRGLPLLAALTACAGRGPAAVSPQEVPDLAARLQKEPDNANLLVRYAAALFAGGSCDSAQPVARRAMGARPSDAVPVMVLGQCQERAGEYDRAVATYETYLGANSKGNGAPAVRARQLLARRDQATSMARRALIQEQQLAQQPGDARTIGILPLQIIGDSSYQPLSRGLAQMMISDIGMLNQFKLVERVQIGALLDEMKFSQGTRVDPATAARVGRLVQAGRIVQGLATIPSSGPVRLEASVVERTGEVGNAGQVNGQMRDLLRLEKDLVVSVVTRLGYTLSVAERQAILENGTQNVQAFLAYSRGLLAEDAGDYSRAALYFSELVRTAWLVESIRQPISPRLPAACPLSRPQRRRRHRPSLRQRRSRSVPRRLGQPGRPSRRGLRRWLGHVRPLRRTAPRASSTRANAGKPPKRDGSSTKASGRRGGRSDVPNEGSRRPPH